MEPTDIDMQVWSDLARHLGRALLRGLFGGLACGFALWWMIEVDILGWFLGILIGTALAVFALIAVRAKWKRQSETIAND